MKSLNKRTKAMKTAISKTMMIFMSFGTALFCMLGIPSKTLGTNSEGLTIFNEADLMNKDFRKYKESGMANVLVDTKALDSLRSSYSRKGNNFAEFKRKILYIGQFRDNPFDPNIDYKSLNIATLDTLDSLITINITKGTPSLESVVPNILSIGGGVQQTIFLDALSSIITERFEEEIISAFFENIYNDMKNNMLMKALFPNTFKLLQIRGEEYIYSNMGQLWKHAFENDLKSSLDNFIAFVDDTSNAKFCSITKNTNEYHAIKASSKMINLIQEGNSPREVITNTSISFNDTNYFIDRRIQLLNLLILNLPPDSVGHKIDTSRIRSDRKVSKYFWGLLYQRNKPLFKDLVLNNENVQNINDYTIQLSKQFNRLYETADIVKKEQKNDTLNYTRDYNLYLKCYIDLINILITKFNLSTNGNIDVIMIDRLQNINQSTLNIRCAIERNQYFDIAFNEIGLLSNLSLGGSTLVNNRFLGQLLKYTAFMADVITAKDENDIKAIIKSYALPRGSFRTKRKSSFCITINSYPGVTFGHEEYLKSGGNKYSEKWAWMTGFTAPIGIDFSFGNTKFLFMGRGKHSDEIMVTVLDLGAMVSYRLSDTLAETPPVTLDQVFSPGIYYVHGFSGYPISIGMGCAFSPKLRAIKINEGTLKSNAWRLNCFAGVDLPLFSIK
jgi:hypothetical protein